jgi:hypothetical protein
MRIGLQIAYSSLRVAMSNLCKPTGNLFTTPVMNFNLKTGMNDAKTDTFIFVKEINKHELKGIQSKISSFSFSEIFVPDLHR